MQRSNSVRAGVAALAAAGALAGAQVAAATTPHRGVKRGPTVRVTVWGRTKELLPTTHVKAPHGFITRGGAPRGKCSADSAQGALNAATHGRWAGRWYASYDEYYITGVMGLNETGKRYYWGIYVNGKLATKGACEIKLHPGERLLFKVTKA